LIPDDIRRFILTSIPSIPYLEAALVLRRNRRESWDAFSLAGALYLAPPTAAELLRELTAAGVAMFDPARQTYRYAPNGGVLHDAFERLAELYRTETIAITQLVHDTAQRSAHRFPSAFKP
jgi:hypothetical protein